MTPKKRATFDPDHKPALRCVGLICEPKRGYTDCYRIAEYIDDNAHGACFVVHWYKDTKRAHRVWFVDDSMIIEASFADGVQAARWRLHALAVMSTYENTEHKQRLAKYGRRTTSPKA